MYKGLIAALAMIGVVFVPFLLTGCGQSGDQKNAQTRTATVTASSYTMAEDETKKGNVGLTAWGDQLKPGMKAIAVSRDLIPKGLTHNTKVKIEGLRGTYRVLDKMNKRWTHKIDIFMGTNKAKAKEWGKRQVNITWTVPKTPKN